LCGCSGSAGTALGVDEKSVAGSASSPSSTTTAEDASLTSKEPDGEGLEEQREASTALVSELDVDPLAADVEVDAVDGPGRLDPEEVAELASSGLVPEGPKVDSSAEGRHYPRMSG
jgi:hypothetical protein